MIRGILQHEFGAAARDMHWTMERPLEVSHGGATFARRPASSWPSSVAATIWGSCCCAVSYALLFYPPVRDVVDPHGYALVGHPGVRKLFPTWRAEGRRYFAATGMY